MITYKLKEMYQMITLGGDAELELVDSLDPFSEGIVFRYFRILFSAFWWIYRLVLFNFFMKN